MVENYGIFDLLICVNIMLSNNLVFFREDEDD